MKHSPKNILVTGAAGFIGFHLALFLQKRGDQVWGLDNFNAYYDPLLKRNREIELKKNGIPILEKDICDQGAIEREIAEKKITHLVHLAAQAGVRHSFTHPHEYVKSNLEGFTAILEALKKTPEVKLIYASSSSVYGKNEKIPFAETDPTDHPANLYGATKKAGEVLATSYHHLYNLSVTGLRYFTVYGPWGRPDMAYYKFTKRILAEKPIEVFGHGTMKRDFTYIDDIIDGTAAAIDLGADHEIFNLGNNTSIPLEELIFHLENGLEKKASRIDLPSPKGECLTTYADISKAQKILNYEPKTSLKTGIHNFLKWYKK